MIELSNVQVASGRVYPVAANLQLRSPVYADRAYVVTALPEALRGATLILTANDDKASTEAAFLSWTLHAPATVYVAHDVRITPKPSWLRTFTDTGKDLVTSDTTLRLFAKAFPAGTITLGGNASGGGYSMYCVAIVPDPDLPWVIEKNEGGVLIVSHQTDDQDSTTKITHILERVRKT